jgi:hypothetical protein
MYQLEWDPTILDVPFFLSVVYVYSYVLHLS